MGTIIVLWSLYPFVIASTLLMFAEFVNTKSNVASSLVAVFITWSRKYDSISSMNRTSCCVAPSLSPSPLLFTILVLASANSIGVHIPSLGRFISPATTRSTSFPSISLYMNSKPSFNFSISIPGDIYIYVHGIHCLHCEYLHPSIREAFTTHNPYSVPKIDRYTSSTSPLPHLSNLDITLNISFVARERVRE